MKWKFKKCRRRVRRELKGLAWYGGREAEFAIAWLKSRCAACGACPKMGR